jgi:hypothetical protein
MSDAADQSGGNQSKPYCDFVGCCLFATCRIEVRNLDFLAHSCNVHAQMPPVIKIMPLERNEEYLE